MAHGLNGLKYLSLSEAQSYATENGRYKLERELGRGGFGVVYKANARDGTNRDVAIKVISVMTDRSNLSLLSSLQGLQDATEEAKTLSKLRNPYVIGFIHYYNFKFPNGRGIGIVTRYCPGGSLGDYLLKDRPDHEKRLQWCRQLSLGIRFIHGRGVAHRDLKPDNILIDGDGVLKIADVGLAKAVWDINEGIQGSQDITFDSYMTTVGGTRAFMAPEVFDGHYLRECDVFSLGLVFACIIEASTEMIGGSEAVVMLATYGGSTHFLGELYHDFRGSRASSACSLMTLQYATPGEIHLINEMCYHDYHHRCSIAHVVTTLESLDNARSLPVVRLHDPQPVEGDGGCCC
ncbi:serine/threonine-protein kinase pdik1l-A-like [Oscarella lobularis]|uniref:serine/threonine-protein kinase pdik1l-A-like n=1 Tax=Oscarella lobularis TaxID=121494 RepID=UPI003313ABE9